MKKIKLNTICKQELKEREMMQIKGGVIAVCGCGCSGTSSTEDNDAANDEGGDQTPGMCGDPYTEFWYSSGLC